MQNFELFEQIITEGRYVSLYLTNTTLKIISTLKIKIKLSTTLIEHH